MSGATIMDKIVNSCQSSNENCQHEKRYDEPYTAEYHPDSPNHRLAIIRAYLRPTWIADCAARKWT